MRCQIVNSKMRKKICIDFFYDIYKNNLFFRDNLSFACKNFMYGTDSFAKSCLIKPYMIYDGHTIAARFILIYNSRYAAVQVACFESRPFLPEVAGIIINRAEEFAKELSVNKIVIGLNGHLTYGVGFLANAYDSPNSFDGLYSQNYYIDYFRSHGLKEHRISTYRYKTEDFKLKENDILKIYNTFSFRKIDLKNFKHEMRILGTIFNDTLKGTPFYFEKTIQETCELIGALKPLLKDENIIFAMDGNKEIGFVFWHPDYNEVLKSNNRCSVISFFLKYTLHKNSIKAWKINAFGVLPPYKGTGVVLGLLNEVYKVTIKRFAVGESGFIFDSNTDSSRIAKRFCLGKYKKYILFEKNLQE